MSNNVNSATQNNTSVQKKRKIPNEELLRLVREADSKGLSYGKFVQQSFIAKKA